MQCCVWSLSKPAAEKACLGDAAQSRRGAKICSSAGTRSIPDNQAKQLHYQSDANAIHRGLDLQLLLLAVNGDEGGSRIGQARQPLYCRNLLVGSSGRTDRQSRARSLQSGAAPTMHVNLNNTLLARLYVYGGTTPTSAQYNQV